MGKALGRITPPDFTHVEKYPLTAIAADARPIEVPVVVGINWYTEFDNPVKDSSGHYWIAKDGRLTSIRGGHCVCLKPEDKRDNSSWWEWYNQVDEGICVGEGCSRMMSLLNRKRYQPRWLYDRCKELDGDPNSDGTYVRVGLDVLRARGHVRAKAGEAQDLTPGGFDKRIPFQDDGISANRWATSVEDVLAALGTPDLDYVTVVNSWGRDYPHEVRMPATVLDRLRREDGEVGIVTDR